MNWPFHAVWLGFRVIVWGVTLTLISPRTLAWIGADDRARWLLHHGWVRWVGLPLMLPFLILSAFHLSVGKPVQGASDDDSSRPGIDPELGLREGPVVRWPVDDRMVEAASWSKGGSRQCVCTATIPSSTAFGFSARSARMEPAWFRGTAQAVMRMGIEQARKTGTDGNAATWDAMSYLSEAPIHLGDIPHGDEIVLRTSQPMLARSLFADPEVGRVIHELEQNDRRWELSLIRGETAGEAVLRFACRGRLDNAEVANRAQALMTAAVRKLATFSPW